jgi:hypothetical protein
MPKLVNLRIQKFFEKHFKTQYAINADEIKKTATEAY